VHCRGGLYTALIVLYAATSGIAGYSGSSYYKQMEGTNWVRPCCTSLQVFMGLAGNWSRGAKELSMLDSS
jgi:Endomembrane protein 70